MKKYRLMGWILLISLQIVIFTFFYSVYKMIWQSANSVLFLVLISVILDFFLSTVIFRFLIYDFLKKEK